MPIDNDGAATLPTFSFLSETSLGWYRSAASSMALSYGTISLPGVVSINSVLRFDTAIGAQTAQLELLYRGSVGLVFSVRGTMQFCCDNNINNAASDKIFYATSGATEGGSGATHLFYARTDGVFVAGNSVTASAIRPNYAFDSDESLGWYRSGVSTIAASYGTLNLATQGVRLSIRTIAASALTASAANTNVAVNECVFTVSASGASFAINSGGTTWVFNSDASAKNT